MGTLSHAWNCNRYWLLRLLSIPLLLAFVIHRAALSGVFSVAEVWSNPWIASIPCWGVGAAIAGLVRYRFLVVEGNLYMATKTVRLFESISLAWFITAMVMI